MGLPNTTDSQGHRSSHSPRGTHKPLNGHHNLRRRQVTKSTCHVRADGVSSFRRTSPVLTVFSVGQKTCWKGNKGGGGGNLGNWPVPCSSRPLLNDDKTDKAHERLAVTGVTVYLWRFLHILFCTVLSIGCKKTTTLLQNRPPLGGGGGGGGEG
jgi:hypothetical protein